LTITYFFNEEWSILKEEYEAMNRDAKRALYRKLQDEVNSADELEIVDEPEVTDVEEVDEVEMGDLVQELITRRAALLVELKDVTEQLNVLRPGKAESKMDICRKIYIANPGMARKDLIELFMNEAGTTKAGSSTYIATIKKSL